MKSIHWFALADLILSLTLAGCGTATTSQSGAGGKIYDIKGKITAVNPDKDKPSVTLAHEDIPGHMNAMEMSFAVRDANLLEGIEVGDRVEGKLETRETGDVIIELKKK